MNKYYLAYGMNTNLYSMSRRCPAARSLGKVTLKNYKLAFKGCCDVDFVPDDSMECVLWSITDACEKSLDILEGYPSYYGKKEVTVNWEGQKIVAMIYYMVDGSMYNVPSESYLEMVAEGYEDHGINLKQIVHALEHLTKLDDHAWQ
jgi:gamma-glutamylcyclotransferase (GGCT)/AIG2-like uncharacterized protein YtfP